MVPLIKNNLIMHGYIPMPLQNATFTLSIFPPVVLLKIRNRMGYYSSLKELQTKKLNRLKTRILK